MANAIDEILASRRKAEERPAAEGDKFFLILSGDGLAENYLEFQFRNGVRTSFSYDELLFVNFDPEAQLLDLDHKAQCIDLEFGGYLVVVIGRGLSPKLYDGIKAKRVVWIKESDVELQDHSGNETFIEEIRVILPKDQTGASGGEET